MKSWKATAEYFLEEETITVNYEFNISNDAYKKIQSEDCRGIPFKKSSCYEYLYKAAYKKASSNKFQKEHDISEDVTINDVSIFQPDCRKQVLRALAGKTISSAATGECHRYEIEFSTQNYNYQDIYYTIVVEVNEKGAVEDVIKIRAEKMLSESTTGSSFGFCNPDIDEVLEYIENHIN